MKRRGRERKEREKDIEKESESGKEIERELVGSTADAYIDSESSKTVHTRLTNQPLHV